VALRHRPMRQIDVWECVEIVRVHPVLGPQYSRDITDLRTVWVSLLGREAFRAVVFEDADDSQVRIMGAGVSVFVSHDFLHELKTPPFFWAGPEMSKRVLRGQSPLLSDKLVRQANADGGLNLVTWVGALHADYLQSLDANIAMFAAFVEEHRGFFLGEVVSQGMSVEALAGSIRSGGLYFSPVHRRYVDSTDKPLHEVIVEPHIVGLTRQLAMARFGTWIGSLFAYQPPQFGFRPSEQRLLLAALQGGTDEDITETLKISLSAVKKTWRSIYDRVTSISPGLIPDKVPEESSSERGKEKKHRMLAYLREHLEELRPTAP
jgi:DNA-binding CsgD family transcriptional regulator